MIFQTIKKNPYTQIQPKTREPYTIIYLVRHANPDYRLQPKLGDILMPLSPEGKLQAKALAARLGRFDIDVAYSSGIARAQETAAIFGNKYKIDIQTDERLNEINWKKWHRVKYFRTSEERRKQHLPEYRALDRQLDNMQTKMRRVLADVYTKHKGERVALFCHGNVIKTFLTGIMNADVLGFLSFEYIRVQLAN